MIAFILAGAAFLTPPWASPAFRARWRNGSRGFKLSHWQLLLALTLFYIVLGCFLDGISMVVLTTSVIMPLVEKAGFDLIWFGIYIVLVVEMAQITPPVGFNLYVLQGMTGRNIFTIGAYALPLFLLMGVAVALVACSPGSRYGCRRRCSMRVSFACECIGLSNASALRPNSLPGILRHHRFREVM